MRCCIKISIAVLIFISQATLSVFAQHGDPRNVLVVINENSPTSIAIGEYYIAKRGIINVLRLPATDLIPDSALSRENEAISYNMYMAKIEPKVKYAVYHNPDIRFVVLTKGIPIRINGHPTLGCNIWITEKRPSVDSILASINYTNAKPAVLDDLLTLSNVGITWVNNYWGRTEPFNRLQHRGLLVTRLDGLNLNDAKALVDRSMSARPLTGSYLLDGDPDKGWSDPNGQPEDIRFAPHQFNPSYSMEFNDFNADMEKAAWELSELIDPARIELDKTQTFVGNRSNLSGYCSWGSNDSHFNHTAYHTLYFEPGALADTAVSFSGDTFLPGGHGQTMIADLITQGATGVKGTVHEPFLDAISSPTYLQTNYVKGMNLAEAFYSAMRFIGWEDVVVGDPLCRPFGATVYGNVTFADYLKDISIEPITVKVFNADGEVVETKTIYANSNGNYSVSLNTASSNPNETYDVWLKAHNWLSRRLVAVDLVDYIQFDFVFYNGDINNDNTIDDFDLLELIGAYGGQSGIPGYPDLTGDGIINDFDLNIVNGGFGNTGE